MPHVGRMAFLLFGIPVYWYGLMIMLGVLAGLLLTTLREKRYGLPRDTSVNLALWVVPAAIICGRLYYVAFTWDHFKDGLWSVVNLRGGGMAIYGSLIGGFLTGIVYAKVKKIRFLTLCDLAAPAAPGPIPVSALTGEGVDALRRAILDAVHASGEQEPGFITSLRHEQLLRESAESLRKACAAVTAAIPHEMLLLDLYAALRPIDAITGATTIDDILGRIFSTFCIGK